MLVNRHRDLTCTPLNFCPNYSPTLHLKSILAHLNLTADSVRHFLIFETLAVSNSSINHDIKQHISSTNYGSIGICTYISVHTIRLFAEILCKPAVVAASEARRPQSPSPPVPQSPQTQLRMICTSTIIQRNAYGQNPAKHDMSVTAPYESWCPKYPTIQNPIRQPNNA